MSLEHVKSMLIVFSMEGCPHCEDYKPRFEAQAERWIASGYPMFWYTSGLIPRGMIPILMIDAASEDPSVVTLADTYAIEGLPTTLLLTRHGRPVKVEGALSDQEIHELLSSAYYANR